LLNNGSLACCWPREQEDDRRGCTYGTAAAVADSIGQALLDRGLVEMLYADPVPDGVIVAGKTL
jgi:hypothetical protein